MHPFSQLQSLNPNTYEKGRSLKEGEDYMRFMVSIYKLQVEGGRIFLPRASSPCQILAYERNQESDERNKV